jgi:hypothetical protein
LNAVSWLVHVGVLVWCWPLLRSWFGSHTGRAVALAVASVLLPILAWCWLVPEMLAFRRREHEVRQAEMLARRRAERERDLAFWSEQVRTGDLNSARLGLELLALWDVELDAVAPVLRTQPGAHPYSPRCACRYCDRSRAEILSWHR